ncbi:hypothetical protein GCM10011391_13440 [Pullulanibacillus camelliae]|uniref:Uncharacterized protein n=1 Tax=Pullulanibacillus camelliae TaxID=1707096 RepID=A0A8J2YE62_9BACL|nr:hypothetical protein GCM10011391_13440 [Pullulanibacillus camelliae]
MFCVIFAINELGIVVTEKLVDRGEEGQLLLIGLSLAAAGGLEWFGMILSNTSLIAILIPLFFVVAGTGMINKTSFSLAMQNQGTSVGGASALLGVLPFVFWAVVAPLVGIGSSHTA